MSALFSPITLAETTFQNRIVVSPMCQYSAPKGVASAWHIPHIGQYLISGAGLFITECTAVEQPGQITPSCLALYNDEQEEALGHVIQVCRRTGPARIGIQLGHSGRKGSCHVPWDGGHALAPTEGAWTVYGPSPIAYDDTRPTPKALDREGMKRVRNAFADAGRRAARIGFDVVELHAAHGYLLHSFLSPITNKRNDEYGGSLENRMRFPLEVASALRDAWPSGRALGVRVNASDFVDGGSTLEDTIVFAKALKARGYDYVCVSSGSLVGGQNIKSFPGYMLPNAARIRKEAGIATQSVGLIVDPQMAEDAVAFGQTDMVAMARAFLDDPRWVWHAAQKLAVKIDYPVQYSPADPHRWPAARLRIRATSVRAKSSRRLLGAAAPFTGRGTRMTRSNSAGKGIVGTWRLTSHLQQTVETGEKAYPRGSNPPGLLTYTDDGRFSIITMAEDRTPRAKVMVTDVEALHLWPGPTAYAGRYSVNGDKVIHHVEISWSELWANTDQARNFILEDDKLTIIAGPDLNPRDGKLAISTFEWNRVQ